MPEFQHRIICASAGTGKTYRLSLEYVALLLTYYGKQEFQIDNILALTFTRKATAEIRERIMQQLDLLLYSPADGEDVKRKERDGLLTSLRALVPGETKELAVEEYNLLLSARREIACDKSRLQVMTIDAYIGNIFRNIVRPLRNIESFDIDTLAIEKRMPFLMQHIMQPEFRHRLNKLLSRKVSRSLDSYAKFFASLIRSRWMLYMITRRLESDGLDDTLRVCDLDSATSAELIAKLKTDFTGSMRSILVAVNDICQGQQKGALLEYFNSDFRSVIGESGSSVASFMQTLEEWLQNPVKVEKLLYILSKGKIVNGTKVSKAKYPQENEEMELARQEAIASLADYLMGVLYYPEQKEIIELWKIILAEYDNLIYRYKNMTYDDISWFSFEALFSEEPPFFDAKSEISATEFYQFLSHRTRFLLIDEFQDTSLIQFNILKPIIEEITSGEGSKPFGGLIVVGDEKQSIFGWRGGQRDLLLRLNQIFPSLHDVTPDILKSCWRCGPTLMSFVNTVFKSEELSGYLAENLMNWNYELISGAGIRHEPDTLVEFCLQNYSRIAGSMHGDAVYADFVSRLVVPALKQDPHGSIAILCRKGKELVQIQQALDECGISSLYQPDRSICVHPLVSPLIDWLRFVAWGDWCDLLGFLRSDYLRIQPKVLKAAVAIIAQHDAAVKKTASVRDCDFSSLPLVSKMLSLAKSHRSKSASQACNDIIDTCLSGKDKSERDYLNLHRFMSIVADWELNNSSGLASIPDFLAYLTENLASEDFKQVSVSGGDSLQLLTIHKSKGLEFRRVFVFFNLSARHQEDSSTLSWAMQYAGNDFHLVKDFGLSYHYNKILKASSYKYLWEEEQKRELLEEMNNLYVALTRAESKLHLYFCYESKDPWRVYLEDPKHRNLPSLICNACFNRFAETLPDSRGVWCLESIFKDETQETSYEDTEQNEVELVSGVPVINITLPPAVNLLENGGLIPNDFPSSINWKQLWLVDHPNLLGDVIHYYLSFIIRNLPNEHQYANKRSTARFGALLTSEVLAHIFGVCQKACEENAWLFEPKWDRVFTEFEIVGAKGVQRLDRLMLDTKAQCALIVDFKSGEVVDKLQLINYSKALTKITAMQDYSVETKFVHITGR
jgi:ATP-dependent exoDNAse (exonuclease V) beta subunit